MKKRLLAMLLALMLVVSLLPTGALADETPEYYRIRNPWALRTAAIEKAGYDSDDLAPGIVPRISTRLFTSDGRYSDANSTLLAGQYYENTSVDATDRGVIMPDEIDRIRVTVSFSDGDYHRHTESVIFDRSEFNWEYDMDSVAGGHDIVWLTLNNTSPSTDGHKVEFYFQPIGKADWELYDIVYVDDGERIGSDMPADPNYGSQDFVSWQTNKDGGGDTLTSETVINKDWVVYGTKTSAGGATAYHVMRDSTGGRYNALQDEVADIYNAEKGTAYNSGNVQITAIQVNGNGDEHTNPNYLTNGWKDGSNYYDIHNMNEYAADATPNAKNTRIPVDEVTGITLIGTIGDNSFSVTIPEDELSLQEITNPVTTDTIVEIKVCDKLDGITKELVDSADKAPEELTGVSYPVDGKVTIPEGGKVTLLYKITVTGDEKAEYKVTDEGATAVSGSLTGTLGTDGVAVIYVTKTFSADDVVDGVLTNSASLSNDNTTLPPDDGNKEDEVEVEVEDEDGEEPEEPGKPSEPTEAELRKLAVVLECTNDEVEHAEKTKTFHLRTTNSKCEIQQVGEGYICSVTPDYDKILSTYNTATKATHEYEDEGKQFVLIWNASTNAWDVASDPSITRQVKCETPEQPDVYEIDVTVHNGTATFRGSEVTSHILAAENEDITITFTPDEGYTLDYATIDGDMLQIPDNGVYTLKLVDRDHTIEVFYESDKIGGGEDGESPDGTPDYRQVFVKYVAADGNGSVAPRFDTFNLEVDENGKVMTDDALSLSGVATPNADATFAYWTIEGLGYDGGAYSYEADLSGKDFTGYVAGQTYTFTAYFNGPVEKPDQVVYNINVEVVNGTAEFEGTNIGANSVINVYPIKDDNKNVTITFVPEDGFVFDAAYVGNEPVDLKDNSYTFGEVTADVTIKVLFKQDSVPITPVTPMPTPGEISDLIKNSITVDCVNGEVAHADKVYGLLDGSLVKVEKTDDTSIKVTLDATVYQARYNTDTETKHSLADGQSATVTFALNYVDKTWRVAEGELPITIKVVCETPVEPEDAPSLEVTKHDDVPHNESVERGDVVEYTITVENTGNVDLTNVVVEDTLWDAGDVIYVGSTKVELDGDSYTITNLAVDETVTITYYYTVTRADEREGEIVNEVTVKAGDNVTDSDTEKTPVDDGWTPKPDDDDTVYVPNWLNTTDHYAYIVGYEDGTIRPQNNITRAEVATIFFRLLTDNARERYWSTTNDFSDVAAESWYNNAISTLSNMGIINGYEDGTFKPNAPITRAEFTAIATRFFDYEAEYDGAFNDVSARAWYADYVQAAVDMGLVDGYPDGGFHPDAYITRAEACTIVNRVLHRVPHEDHLLSESVMNTWPDNPKSAWYYEDMQEATNSHDYDWIRVDGETVEDWTKKLPERDWSALETEWATAYSR